MNKLINNMLTDLIEEYALERSLVGSTSTQLNFKDCLRSIVFYSSLMKANYILYFSHGSHKYKASPADDCPCHKVITHFRYHNI